MAWRSHHGALTEFEQRRDPVVEREKAVAITALFAHNKVR
jgi:hypothetical protein